MGELTRVKDVDVGAPADERPKTIYRPDVIKHIKADVGRVWDRVRKNKNLTQANLARALGTTQSAVSKLLNDDNGHPWTETYLRKFSEFCGVSPREFLDKELMGFITEWNNDGQLTDHDFVEECISALANYFSSKGLPARRERLASLAAKLAARLDGTHPDSDTMDREIECVILENALGSG
jgi:transcriptional regulator with XRE-family HTH domain